jgi:hypothetical protein
MHEIRLLTQVASHEAMAEYQNCHELELACDMREAYPEGQESLENLAYAPQRSNKNGIARPGTAIPAR